MFSKLFGFPKPQLTSFHISSGTIPFLKDAILLFCVSKVTYFIITHKLREDFIKNTSVKTPILQIVSFFYSEYQVSGLCAFNMPPAFSSNHTGVQIYVLRCGGSYFPPRICGIRFVSNDNDDLSSEESFGLFKLLFGPLSFRDRYHNNFMERDPENDNFMQQRLLSSSTILPPSDEDQQSSNDALLQFVAFKILLPIVMILIAICFVLGVVLIVKSYMMAPLKQNLATAIRRRRQVGQAPENNYIPQAEIRASQRMSSASDRKSLPPPEVLMAARERASQLMSA